MTIASDLLSRAKAHARIVHDDDDAALALMLEAAAADVLGAANYTAPETLAELPDDLALAICDQAVMLFDTRSGATERERPLGLTLAASRIVQRYRGVSLGEVSL